MSHILALSTYGSKRKKRDGKRLSALKIGAPLVANILLKLISTARDISSHRDSYTYIHLPNKPRLRHNWLFVDVSDDELAQVEKLALDTASARGVALWRDDGWQLLPWRDHPAYRAASNTYDAPKGSPHGFWAIRSTGDKAAAGGADDPDKLIAEYAKLKPNKPAWWWIPANDATWTHKSTLKRAGCKWSRRRYAYYYIGDQLPEQLLTLLDNAAECRAIMEGMTPEEARIKYRHPDDDDDPDDTSQWDTSTPIQSFIEVVLKDHIKTIHTAGAYPILMTDDNLGLGQDTIGIATDNRRRLWYLFGQLSDQQRQLMTALNAEWSANTRRWLIQEDGQVAALDAFLATLDLPEPKGFDDDTDPCTLEEAAEELGMSVQRDEPLAVYKRGRTAWTTRRLPAGKEARTEPIEARTKYTIRDIDFSGDPLNPVYLLELENGSLVRAQEEELLPQRRFERGETVYARHDSETSEGTHIPTGHPGTITKRYRYNPHLGRLRGHSYDVDWQDIGTEWMFQDELSPDPPVGGICITRKSLTNDGGKGTSPSDDRKAIVQANGKSEPLDTSPANEPEQYDCSCEAYDGPQGWLPAESVGTWIACGICNPGGTNRPTANPGDPDAEAPPAIRIIKGAKLNDDTGKDDPIQSAIRRSRTSSPSKTPSTTTHPPSPLPKTNTLNIPQAYVGELTGSVIANVHCYGYATSGGILIYLNMGGPRSGVEAIRAKLGKGEAINLVPDEGPSIELTPGDGQTGMYTAFITNLSEARFVSMNLVHDDWIEPNYNGKSKTYILQVNEAQAKGQLLHHVRELVSVPVFDNWIEYLWQAGQTAMLLRSCPSAGGITMYILELEADSWKRLITGGVANDIIHIPHVESP